jgi:RNA polymerase sigma-70 factor (ECF subfamily)
MVVDEDPDGRMPADGELAERGLTPTASDEAIAQLVSWHGAALLRFLLRLTKGDRGRSEDIYQETLLRAWKHPDCYREGPGSSRQWLFTVARRVSIDQLRATAARPALVHDERQLAVAPDSVNHIDRMLLAGEVRAAVATLSAAHQQVLQEIYFQDRPLTEVAERLDLPVGTVKSRTYYALRALKAALVERGLDNFLAKCA